MIKLGFTVASPDNIPFCCSLLPMEAICFHSFAVMFLHMLLILLGMENVVTVGKSTNILWHDCPIGKLERQMLLKQKGCVIWITGLSGSGL